MSQTIQQSPAALMPAYNNVITVLTSSNQTEEGFQFICDLYSAGTTTRLSREKTPQNPAGYGVFDSHRILENYVSYDLVPASTGITSAVNSRFKYDLKLGEEYKYYWPFVDNMNPSGVGGRVGFSGNTPHGFVVGDRVLIAQSGSPTFPEYDGVQTVWSASTNFFIIDYDSQGSTPLNPGTAIYADGRKTIFSGLTNYTGLTVNNAAFSHLDWINYNQLDWDCTGATKQFLTDAPNEYEMQLTNQAWLIAYCSNTTLVRRMVVTTYNQANTLLGEYRLDTAAVNDTFAKVAMGPWNITNAAFVASTGSLPVFTDTVKYYTVYIADSSGNQLSEAKRFTVNQECSKYNNIELVFLDRKGSFLTRNFQLASRQSLNIKKEEYRKPYGGYNGSSWTYNTYDRGRTVFNVDVTRTYQATSNWMTEDDAAYLEQLFTSGNVYMNDNGTFLPIIVKDTNFELKTTINNKLINYTISFEMGFNDEVQR